MGVNPTREEVELKWTGLLAEELDGGGEVRRLRDTGELEESWGLEKGSVLDVMLQGDMQGHYEPDYI